MPNLITVADMAWSPDEKQTQFFNGMLAGEGVSFGRRHLPRVQIYVARSMNTQTVTLYTDDSRIPRHTFYEFFQGPPATPDYMTHCLQYYVRLIIQNGYATEDLIDLPPEYDIKARAKQQAEAQAMMEDVKKLEREKKRLELKRHKPNPFEVNMMEALTGWKSWKWREGEYLLTSPTYGTAHPWCPDTAHQARCLDGCKEVPHEHHTCGVYAGDTIEQARNYGAIYGQVYGWGRYVRGDKGWRAQFAYPKSFHLTNDQAHLVEYLRRYHCPIYVEQPMLIYNPAEDGYDSPNEESPSLQHLERDSESLP